MVRWFLICLVLLLPLPAFAQEEDKGFITNFLEDNLGGEGRRVEIFGFAGALSNRATIERIVISDENGVWLSMEQVGLQWNRSALLRGQVEIEELSAATIDLARLPVAPDSDVPPAEASGFALPELPVSIRIEALTVTQVTLGVPVLGEAAAFSISGAAGLANGSADVSLEALRTDGRAGEFRISAAFDGNTQDISLDLNLTEAEGGIAARLLDLPDRPSVALRLSGSGTLDNLQTDLELRTDGAPRLNGTITLQAEEAPQPGRGPTRRFGADISGDITALFAPQYRPFFGDDLQLRVAGLRADDGALDLETIALRTEALQFDGAVALNRDFWPVLLDIDGRLARDDGEAVLLPLTGPETYVDAARFQLAYDQADGERWNGIFAVTGFARGGLRVAQTDLKADGILDGQVNAIGKVTAALDLAIAGLDLGDAALNAAAGSAISGKLSVDFVEGQDLKLRDLDLSGADYALRGRADVSDLDSGFETMLDVALDAEDLSRFADLIGQNLSGATKVTLKGTADLGGAFDLEVRGDARNLKIGQPQADAVLAGTTRLEVEAQRTEQGIRIPRLDLRNPQFSAVGNATLASGGIEAQFDARLQNAGLVLPDVQGPLTVSGTARTDNDGVTVDVSATGPYKARATARGLVTGAQADVDFTASFPDVSALVPEVSGAVALSGNARQSPDGWLVDTELSGPYDLQAALRGRVTGTDAPDLQITARLPDIQPLLPAYRGSVAIEALAQKRGDGWHVDTQINGPYDLNASAKGRATGNGAPDLSFTLDLPDVSPFAPQFRGSARASGSAVMDGDALQVTMDANGPYGLTATVSGPVTGPAPQVQFNARLPDIAPIVGQISGPLSVSGLARQEGSDWFVDTAVQGPAGTQADVVGRVRQDGRLSINAAGAAPLSLANPFLAPRSVQGQATFDLRIDGPPALNAVSGRVSLRDGRLAAPNLRAALNNIDADVTLNSGQAVIALTSEVSSGGALTVRGPVTLSGSYPAALAITLADVRIVDPSLYRTSLDGALQVNGPLRGGARIAGRIDVGETRVSVPSTGVGGFSIIPEITHLGATPAVRATQRRAGLGPKPALANGASASYPLDVTISAPSRIFVRGRGLDAELGGRLRLTGSTTNLISAGRFELIRGRLDILEKRFVLDEGSIQLQGTFDPFLRFVATTNTDQGTASVVIEGPASQPDVRFEASPEAPEDEVLAQIFFGRQVTQLSAFQALQLASAVATLAGRGGEGVVSKLRRGFDLDDLDISTDESGQTALTAGKYISENVYTDVTVGGADGAEASINVDLTPSVTVRGSATANGDTAVGIYFERDY
ncbi:MAG: translocation/assembly module TamB domain-containing protein [Pseudomonadota bacterium]